ncbi:MAG TPA: Gfo/Idh/MocA family oxidoreductase [Bryobacteraceae bacterium]|nr:Gfo/Idh/MocA family oxidoreductase [Bryobacteraceae bacterium]
MIRVLAIAMLAMTAAGQPPQPLRLAIAGLVHGHVDGFLRAASNRTDVRIVGVFDADAALRRKYAEKYGLSESIFFTDLPAMLDTSKPEAVAAFTSTWDHPAVVEASAARHIHVMMEKPLAVSVEHARRIERASERGGIHVIVNYETTWYASHGALWKLMKEQAAAGRLRKIVAMDGHSGPKEIGVAPEFFTWLTDPVKNGACALFDFGCYGVNLMTWLMDNQRPLAVTAIAQQIKPAIYPRVDDEATLILEYPEAQGIIQASWNWPFNRKDLEVYAERGYAFAIGGNVLRVRLPGHQEETRTPEPLAADQRDSISYLTAIARGRCKPAGLSSLANNVIVAEILEAARESSRNRKRVVLRER